MMNILMGGNELFLNFFIVAQILPNNLIESMEA